MWETLECRQLMSVTLDSDSTLPYIEQTPTTVDGGSTTVDERGVASTISGVQKQMNDSKNALIRNMT